MTARRAIGWALGVARVVSASVAVGVVLAWVASRVVTDRLGWSQYVWWIPTLVWAAASVATLALWWVLALAAKRLSSRGVRRARSGAGRRPLRVGRLIRSPRPLVALVILAMLARAAIIEWRLYRFVAPPRGADGIRIVCWNPALPVDSLEPLLVADADVYLIANEGSGQRAHELAGDMGDGARSISQDRMTVVSRLPIRRWATTRLGLAGRVLRSYQFMDIDAQVAEQVDEGRALFVELETPGGGSLVVWLVDLPSDPRLLRRDVTATAGAKAESFSSRVFRFDDAGGRVVEQMRDGLPEPDVIAGDFNIPRGSSSLRTLVGDRANAFDQAGRGYGATFPRERPLSQIDQMFVGDGWRATSYRIFDPGSGLHLAQVGEIVRDPAD